MPRIRKIRSFPKYVADTLKKCGWLGVEYNDTDKSVSCPNGKIVTYKNGNYSLYFWYYASDKKTYELRSGLTSVSFPETFDFRNFIYFRYTGNYRLNNEYEIKHIIEPVNGSISEIDINRSRKTFVIDKNRVLMGISIFKSIASDAQQIYEKCQAYKKSAERYYLKLKSQQYTGISINKTTYVEKDEFKFLVDRLNLETKKKKADIDKYISKDDLGSIENLTKTLLDLNACSEEFLRKLNDFIIREKLNEVISLGQGILGLKQVDLDNTKAEELISKLGSDRILKLEGLWQKYFEHYLLYLIFTYKKIFPKVRLKNIDGDKKYPDFIGINHYNGLEVIEIKTHLKKILSWDPSHNNFYFTPEMNKAIIQTVNYMDSIVRERFVRSEDKTNITQYTEEENLYHPRGVIIISSLTNLTTKRGKDELLRRDFTKLRNSLQNIEIITFDEVLTMAKEYVTNITK